MNAQPLSAHESAMPGRLVHDHLSPVPIVSKNSTQAAWAAETLRALSHLDRIERSALRLIYWHGVTLAEASAQLGISEVMVQHHVVNGMRQLAERLVARRR